MKVGVRFAYLLADGLLVGGRVALLEHDARVVQDFLSHTYFAGECALVADHALQDRLAAFVLVGNLAARLRVKFDLVYLGIEH